MRINGSKFLVVGGAGFIGSHVVDALLENGASQVRIYDNFSRGRRTNLSQALQDKRTQIFEPNGDILHTDTLKRAMEEVDGVFHLAALWLLQCFEFPRSAFDVNINGTMNVIEAVMNQGVKKIVFSSSASVYGEPLEEPMKENHPLNCGDFYGASKVSGEMLLKAMHNQSKLKSENAFDFAGLRYMNVYGPRQYDQGDYIGVVVRMLNDLDAGNRPVIHGTGQQAYDFIDVRDCAQANIAAMESETSGEFFNIGTGVKTSIKNVAQMLSERHPSKLAAQYKKADRPAAVQNRLGDVSKASALIGFNAQIPFAQGLTQYIEWRQQNRADKQ